MRLTRLVVATFSIGMMVLGAGVARGQDFPNKPIRLVTSPIGGGNDFTARLVAQGLTGGSLGQQKAQARPGELNYGSGGIGGGTHLAAELFKSMAGANITRINYKGSGPVLYAVVTGQVQMTFSSAASVAPHVKSGRARALAITSAQPSPLFPGLTTASGARSSRMLASSLSSCRAPGRSRLRY